MRDALRRHDAILREAIESRQGYVFKTIGDAFCAAFPTVAQALEAAVETQRRLGREDFSAVDALHVRIAIHAGETDERDGDYFGAAVNRTARLLAAGHGGQILLSGDAADSALARLPAGITLRHLGWLPLKDIARPERVYQPAGEGLRSDFKPLRALETPPNNLPWQATSFVGRHDDLAHLEALLEEARLVTVVGAGGIGKTRLALEVAASRLNDEVDGAWFVDLSSIGDAGLIAGTILSALGGELSPGGDPLGDLAAYLQKRSLLIVLDNSEHLVAEVAGIVAQIIARCPHVAVLATSRSPLDISGERVYRLASLDLGSAARLFADRARAANPALGLEEKTSIVEDICARLDGIALAIELAAARLRSMSIESLASHLELRLLAGGRDRRPRQQTMSALIGWSYDLLSDEEQRTLRYASVFLRGFTVALAADVCADSRDEWQVFDLLVSLADKSLLVLDGEEENQRFRLLEPIREYAWNKLNEEAEADEARRRHAGAFGLLANSWYEEWDNGPARDWIARLERDLANLRAALRWSFTEAYDPELGVKLVANATIVFLRLVIVDEGVEYCRRVLEGGFTLSRAVEARLRYGLSMLYSNLGKNKNVLEEALIAAAMFREAGDERGLTRALSQVASRYADESRYDEARAKAVEALQLARNSGDRRLLADTLRRCASAFAAEGPKRVRELFAEGVAIFRTLDRDDETARALEWWGKWEEDQANNFEGAAERFLEAARLESGRDIVMYRAVDIAGCYLAIGDGARAEPFARDALAKAARTGHPVLTPMAIAYLAIIRSTRDADGAARLIGYAEDRLRAAEWQRAAYEQRMVDALFDSLRERFSERDLKRLFEEGKSWTDAEAATRALAI